MNKTIKTIVIDDNNEDVNCITNYFNQNANVEIIETFSDGGKALEYLLSNSKKVDIIIMDMLLPTLDGYSLIEKLLEKQINIKTIITSHYKEERIIKDLTKYGVIGYFVKPFNLESLEKRILTFNTDEYIVEKKNIDYKISELLHNLGIPSHIRGYKYIRDGITMIYNNDAISLITKEIYPQVAYRYETTPSRVERAIRHAIEVSWARGDITLMEDLFGFSISCEKSKPTNSEFLSTIADRLRLLNNES